MEVPTNVNYIAIDREETLTLEDNVHIFSRTGIRRADPNSDEGKISQQINNVEFLGQNHRDAIRVDFQEKLARTMLSDECGEKGPDKFLCPFIKV